MSDSEEEREVGYFGTPLEPYDEDAFPKKRPITVEEQVARDAQGRRRFHGAFTGGFSAGFFNTVGSLEGWTPSEFKSSRGDKAQNKQQKPEDFMDDEDVGEFGIAPQTVRATDNFATGKKRKRKTFSDGPIPGEPVLETLIQAGNETIGYFLMKNINQKHKLKDQPGPKVYGCVMPKDLPTEDAYEHPQYNLHAIYSQYMTAPKCNTFGLGYVGLDKTHVALFKPTNLTVRERNNKKLSISGQAFGVGAFENDDDDIYVKDDMSRYDFEITSEKNKQEQSGLSRKNENSILNVFVSSKTALITKEVFPPPVIPSSFTGKHNIKKSRFEPVPDEKSEPPERKTVNAAVRAKYLGEGSGEKTYTPSNQQHKQPIVRKEVNQKETKEDDAKVTKNETSQVPTTSGLVFDRFVSAQLEDDPTNMLETVKPSETTHGTKEMRAAVKLKMFGPLTRVTISWQPNSFLCKRFNVPEPHFEELNAQRNKKRTKNLIFEYQKHVENEALHKPGLTVQKTDENVNSEPKNDKSELSEAVEQETTEPVAHNVEEQPSKEEKAPVNEKVIDMTERVDVSKNTDLFKAVFLSSSESESESEAVEDVEDKRRKEEITANVLSEPLVPKIKSTKEGILSNIDFSKLRPNKGENKEETLGEVRSRDKDLPVDDNIYGPALPSTASAVKTAITNDANVNDDGWVEKGVFQKEKKHKKKHKKEKSREKHKKKRKHKSKR